MLSDVNNIFFAKRTAQYFTLLVLLSLFLVGCASSNVSRVAEDNIDLGVQNAKNLVAADGSYVDAFDNLTQTTKGAILGGSLGAILGSTYSAAAGFLPGTAIGLIMGASYGAYIDANTTLEDRLKNRGVNVVVLGDQILIVLPSYRIFSTMTASIKQGAYPTMNLVTEYINKFNKMMVKVAGFTNDSGSRRLDIALSDQQARSVAKYLIENGVDSRIIYACGYGGTHLVAGNTPNWEGSDNYRIEITLERLYV